MSMIMVTAYAASTAAMAGGSSGCPVSSFGWVCLTTSLVMIVLAMLCVIPAMLCHWNSPWFDRWCGVALALLVGALIPILVGMIHDC